MLRGGANPMTRSAIQCAAAYYDALVMTLIWAHLPRAIQCDNAMIHDSSMFHVRADTALSLTITLLQFRRGLLRTIWAASHNIPLHAPARSQPGPRETRPQYVILA